MTGWMKQRLALLLAHDINLFAYHLPLDAHPELGNNAQLGLQAGPAGDAPLRRAGPRASSGSAPTAAASRQRQALAAHVREGARPARRRWSRDAPRPMRRIAWCTGGAQGYFEAAIAAGADAFITGEISEPQAHYARECGVAFLACGHHATRALRRAGGGGARGAAAWAGAPVHRRSTTRHEHAASRSVAITHGRSGRASGREIIAKAFRGRPGR